MADSTSRYRSSGTRTAMEPDGSLRQYTAFREIPVVEGTYQHTISEIDRLDRLGYTYYGKSQRWWRIADANPEAETPLVLLGDPARSTVTFEFNPLNLGTFSFAQLRVAINSIPGVVDVSLEESLIGYAPANRIFEGEQKPRTVYIPEWRRSVTIEYYELRPDVSSLSAAIERQGCMVTGVGRHEQVGQTILIPPDTRI